MDSNNNQTDGKFFNGFLLGALVGAFVVFLLGTKKGKKLLKAISQDGIDNIANILDEAGKSEEERDKSEGQGKDFAQEREIAIKEESIEEKPKVRRFFRGISRRVN